MTYRFTKWFETVKKSLSTSDLQFKSATSDTESIQLMHNYSEYLDCPVHESFNEKSTQKSCFYRKEGNQLYTKGDYKEALKDYSKSICYAVIKSKELSLAYANRSAALFNMCRYSLCLIDIDLALSSSYPVELQYKLYERQGCCFQAMKQNSYALKSFQKCLGSLDKLAQSKKQEIQFRVNKIIDDLSIPEGSSASTQKFSPVNQVYETLVPCLPSVNEIYLSCSASFSIIFNDFKGRHAVASQTIYPGEIIVVEKPYSSVCIPSSHETHCYACFKRFLICYPCRNCSTIRYCSLTCEELLWSKSHQYECRYMNVLIADDIGLGHLAMKMIVETKLDDLLSNKLKADDCCENGGLNESNVYDSSDYSCIVSLVGNRKFRSLKDLFRRALLAIFLAKILKFNNYFEDNICKLSKKETEMLIASHILKQLEMLPCNAHEISELKVTDNNFTDSEPIEIGSAVYGTLSLLNHSCDPSVVRHCYGSTCVLRAIKRINVGEEIIDNYGFLYPVECKDDRIKHLNEQYYFVCQCVACKEDWPLYQAIADSDPECICAYCNKSMPLESKACSECKGINNVGAKFKEMRDKFQKKLESVLDTGNFEDSLDFLLKYLDIVSSRAILPTLCLNNCQEIVKLCFSLQANCVTLKSS